MPIPFALMALGAGSTHEGTAAARNILARAPRCRCCDSHWQHLSKYVGSLLFLDDNPRRLAEAVPRAERSPWTERLFAACIVLHGRARVARS